MAQDVDSCGGMFATENRGELSSSRSHISIKQIIKLPGPQLYLNLVGFDQLPMDWVEAVTRRTISFVLTNKGMTLVQLP